MLQPITRPEVDKVLAEYFPGGTWSRRETGTGWSDLLSIGFLNLRVAVQEKDQKAGLIFRLQGEVRVDILSVRTGDGSDALLWRMEGAESTGLVRCVREARMVLVGLASGILMVSDQEVVPLETSSKVARTVVDWN